MPLNGFPLIKKFNIKIVKTNNSINVKMKIINSIERASLNDFDLDI